MDDLISIKITIRGITPLLCNKFTDQAAMAASDGTRSSAAAGDRGTPREICEQALYLDEKGKPCIPQPNLLRCIVDGGSFHKAGKKQITTKQESLLYGCLDIEELLIPIKFKQPWSVDTRPIVNPSTKGRVLRHRPKFYDWELSFKAQLNTAIVGINLLRKIVDDAGVKCGLGDYRPNRKGPFGRFVVVHWQELRVPQPAAEAA
jgi:hypothetical protein